jgi:hypothetical protein
MRQREQSQLNLPGICFALLLIACNIQSEFGELNSLGETVTPLIAAL